MTKAEATSRLVALCGAKQGPQGFVAEPQKPVTTGCIVAGATSAKDCPAVNLSRAQRKKKAGRFRVLTYLPEATDRVLKSMTITVYICCSRLGKLISHATLGLLSSSPSFGVCGLEVHLPFLLPEVCFGPLRSLSSPLPEKSCVTWAVGRGGTTFPRGFLQGPLMTAL